MFKLVSVNTVEGAWRGWARRARGASASARTGNWACVGRDTCSGLTGGMPAAVCWRVGTGFANEFNATCCAAAAVPVGTGAMRNGMSVDVKTAIGKFYAKTVR